MKMITWNKLKVQYVRILDDNIQKYQQNAKKK